MSVRFTLYLKDDAEDVLLGHEGQRSQRINQVVEDYREMVLHLVPELDLEDWLSLVKLCEIEPKAFDREGSLKLLWALVQDHVQGTPGSVFARKLKDMTYPQLIALSEVVRSAARLSKQSGHETPMALQLAGARMLMGGRRAFVSNDTLVCGPSGIPKSVKPGASGKRGRGT